MTKYREILRLKSLGYSERNIALCCSVSRNTVAKVCARAKKLGITWPLAPDQTDKVLSKMLFPKEKTTAKRRMPGYEWVRKELLRNGVTRKLLWNEYCEETRSLGELPLMYSQCCYYLQEAEHISHATMHIPRRPENQKNSNWYTPVLNQVYHEMAEHYGTAIIPARVIKPKEEISLLQALPAPVKHIWLAHLVWKY